MKFAEVIVDISAGAVDRPFTYSIPPELEGRVKRGAHVKLPFGRQNQPISGVVIDIKDDVRMDHSLIKSISSVEKGGSGPDEKLIQLALFMAAEYGCTLNQALKTVLPIKRAVRKNARRTDPVSVIAKTGDSVGSRSGLSFLQQKVYEEILATTKPSLIYGITGSGKTRIYTELIRAAQKKGKSSIFLIPEISLTYQTVRELRLYLGERIAVMHSRLSAGERYEEYLKVQNGAIDVMIGPRSALFAPFSNLGLIIIDEEHENTYHSDTSPRYDTRVVAEKLAALSGAKLVLGSATPSLESYKKALDKVYALHVLKERAHPGAVLPAIHLIDMRGEFAGGNRSIFSARLRELMEDRLLKDEQIMLFLNRRGYAGFASCRSCGLVFKCPHCDVSLTVHNSWYRPAAEGRMRPHSFTNERSALLSCHYCGYTAPLPKICPSCGSPYVAPFGLGTQKLEVQVKKMFPKARVLRMDADTTRRKGSYEQILSTFKDRKADILIGTQMIAKGHDFEKVTLVGVVSADISLYSNYYNAAERTYELLTQAAGRSGRSDRQGDVVIQSYAPDHYAISTAAREDYESFFAREYSFRKLLKYPPHNHLLFLRFSSADEAKVSACADLAAQIIRDGHFGEIELIGPCNETIYKLRDNFRKILYIKHFSHDIIIRMRDQVIRVCGERFSRDNVLIQADFR